jgi:uncharacterized membrane-anchored protein
MRALLVAASAAFLATVVLSTPLHAQDSEAESRARNLMARIQWVDGPTKGKLGIVAEVGVPAGCQFTDAQGSKLFMELTENPSSGDELGVLLCENKATDSHWFVLFSWDASGYVKDDEQGTLDRKAILESLQDGTRAGNAERRAAGWSELELVGWQLAPFYDPTTHNLTWSTKLREKGSDDETINHSVRLLGRGGVMHADLVIDPTELATSLPVFGQMIGQYEFVPGQTYAEWRDGDKIAEYGLTALIAGGAGAAAVKMGFFGKLWKLILGVLIALKKLVVVVVVAIAAGVKKLLGKGDGESASEKKPAASGSKPPAKSGGSQIGVQVKRVVAVPQDLPPRSSSPGGPTASQANLPKPPSAPPANTRGNGGGTQGPIGPMGS